MNAEIGQEIPKSELPKGAKYRFGKSSITGNVAFSPDGTRLAVAGDIGTWIYDVQTGEEVSLLAGHTEYVWSIVYSPDGDTVASGSYEEIWLWDGESGLPKTTLSEHRDYVRALAYSPDGKTLASGGADNIGILWDVVAEEARVTLKGHTGSFGASHILLMEARLLLPVQTRR